MYFNRERFSVSCKFKNKDFIKNLVLFAQFFIKSKYTFSNKLNLNNLF